MTIRGRKLVQSGAPAAGAAAYALLINTVSPFYD
jgi:hypothetical protein